MAGSIEFLSGASWSAGSTLYDAAIATIAEVGEFEEGAAFDALRTAGQLGWLVLRDVAEPARSEMLSTMQSAIFRDHLIEVFADGAVLGPGSVRDLVDELNATARNESGLAK